MNTPTIVRTTRTEWLRRGIAITGALLISGAIALGLANRAAITVAPAAPAASVSAGQERFAALKELQAELRDNTFVPAPEVTNARERFEAFKQRQAELRDATFVPTPAQDSGRARFADLKQRQAELREEGR
ncbi:MAG TPA: hypothetical protein VFO07_14325 [Roseiflexaceae bacterium]|nr:hypothetical protein [Roseiflexaceae bacterium]